MNIAVITPISHLNGVKELISSKGNLFLLEEGSKHEVRELLLKKKIDVILCNPNQQTFKIDEALLIGTNVSIINTCSTGLNHIDIHYCESIGIKIYSLTKDFDLISHLPSTAELAFGLMLDLMRNITKSNNVTKNDKTWNYLPFVGQQIKDFKIGIVGFGRLGKMMAKYCTAFDAQVYIYDPYSKDSNVGSLKSLFDLCDAISLHVHVNDETRYMIDYDLLSRNVKFLINTSRGEIVNEFDVIKALKENRLLGYGTDVIEDEFDIPSKSPFFNSENSDLNCIITPHIGGMTHQGQEKAYKWAINKL